MSLNKVLLIGNAGKDPEVRHLESGVVTATFSLATTERYRDRISGENREQTEWHNIVCWRNLADIADKYVRKGTQLFIEGRIRSRSYNDRDGNTRYVTEIVADNMQLLGRKADNPAAQGQGGGWQGQSARPSQAPVYQSQPQATQPQQSPAADLSGDEIGDDLPF
ncbi:MAG TPA: single-stranded DNA-binding protein [Candidatus Coprenecus pullistercoris]|nr:single-stranded DNA-binding protein [Candidatus Coprenecus pullistercoris]